MTFRADHTQGRIFRKCRQHCAEPVRRGETLQQFVAPRIAILPVCGTLGVELQDNVHPLIQQAASDLQEGQDVATTVLDLDDLGMRVLLPQHRFDRQTPLRWHRDDEPVLVRRISQDPEDLGENVRIPRMYDDRDILRGRAARGDRAPRGRAGE